MPGAPSPPHLVKLGQESHAPPALSRRLVRHLLITLSQRRQRRRCSGDRPGQGALQHHITLHISHLAAGLTLEARLQGCHRLRHNWLRRDRLRRSRWRPDLLAQALQFREPCRLLLQGGPQLCRLPALLLCRLAQPRHLLDAPLLRHVERRLQLHQAATHGVALRLQLQLRRTRRGKRKLLRRRRRARLVEGGRCSCLRVVALTLQGLRLAHQHCHLLRHHLLHALLEMGRERDEERHWGD